jgi:hypothetical protein
MYGQDDTPLTDEELALAREGEKLIATSVAGVRAPQSLREAIERERARAEAPARAPAWRRHRWSLAAAAIAAAALAVVATAIETGRNDPGPSPGQVYAAARLNPTKAPPASVGGDPPVLDARVGTLTFPDWQQKFGWRAVGRREDNISGRSVTTVFYRNPDGARLGYAVVAGKPIDGDPAGHRIHHEGKSYHVAGGRQRTVITWTQQGHTCVIVAPAIVPRPRVVSLAASRNV